jgi:hypothetical protein
MSASPYNSNALDASVAPWKDRRMQRVVKGAIVGLLLTACGSSDDEAKRASDAGIDAPADVVVDGNQENDAATTDAGTGGSDAGTDASTSNGGVGPTITEFTESGPIEVTSGMTIEGMHITSTNGPCIKGSGVENVRITNNKIGPCAPGVDGIGISFEGGSHDVRIDHNAFDDVATAYYTVGDGDNNVFDHNLVERVRGPFPRGQMVQFNTVTGTGNQVLCNVSDQPTPGYLDGPEDHVSTFASNGTDQSPLLVAYNKIRGGGPSKSGGGILAGDYDGSYIEIRGNILVNPGQYGLAVAGGRNSKIVDNLVYAPDAFEWSNNGLFVWAQVGSGECYGHQVQGNRVFYVNAEGTPNAGWNAGNCGEILGFDDNVFVDTTLTSAIWDTVIPECE